MKLKIFGCILITFLFTSIVNQSLAQTSCNCHLRDSVGDLISDAKTTKSISSDCPCDCSGGSWPPEIYGPTIYPATCFEGGRFFANIAKSGEIRLMLEGYNDWSENQYYLDLPPGSYKYIVMAIETGCTDSFEFVIEPPPTDCDPCHDKGGDSDQDGICDNDDNCPNTYNPSQENIDNDEEGDACDPCIDQDGDKVCDEFDNCKHTANEGQEDTDNDGIGDVCDDCLDNDDDGICDESDQCPGFDDKKLGDPCDDGNPNTFGDIWDECECKGSTSSCSSGGADYINMYFYSYDHPDCNNPNSGSISVRISHGSGQVLRLTKPNGSTSTVEAGNTITVHNLSEGTYTFELTSNDSSCSKRMSKTLTEGCAPGCVGNLSPGDSCDDGNSNTVNDRILADGCTCRGNTQTIGDEVCYDNFDNDGDGLVDCDDPDCRTKGYCYEYNCWDGKDNDGDGVADCDDPDCLRKCPETNCSDGIDNNGNGKVDCEDPLCDCFCFICQTCPDGGEISPKTGVPISPESVLIVGDNQFLSGGGSVRFEQRLEQGMQLDLVVVSATSERTLEIRYQQYGGYRIDELVTIPANAINVSHKVPLGNMFSVTYITYNTGILIDAVSYQYLDFADCTQYENTWQLCRDGVDNDGDGLTDCEDPNCIGVGVTFSDCQDQGCFNSCFDIDNIRCIDGTMPELITTYPDIPIHNSSRLLGPRDGIYDKYFDFDNRNFWNNRKYVEFSDVVSGGSIVKLHILEFHPFEIRISNNSDGINRTIKSAEYEALAYNEEILLKVFDPFNRIEITILEPPSNSYFRYFKLDAIEIKYRDVASCPLCIDSDADGVCDDEDICPGGDDNLDSDFDSIPNDCDLCDGRLEGTPCGTGDNCTYYEYDANCNCNQVNVFTPCEDIQVVVNRNSCNEMKAIFNAGCRTVTNIQWQFASSIQAGGWINVLSGNSEILDLNNAQLDAAYINVRKYRAIISVEGCEDKISNEIDPASTVTLDYSGCEFFTTYSDDFCIEPTHFTWFHYNTTTSTWDIKSTVEDYTPTESGQYAFRVHYGNKIFAQAPVKNIIIKSCESIVSTITQTSCSTLEVDYDAGCRASSVRWEYAATQAPTANFIPIANQNNSTLDVGSIGVAVGLNWRKFKAIISIEDCDEYELEYTYDISAVATYENCVLTGSYQDGMSVCTTPIKTEWIWYNPEGFWDVESTEDIFRPTKPGRYVLRYTFGGDVFVQAPEVNVPLPSCESITPTITQTSCSTLQVDYDAGCRNSSIQWEWLASPTAVTGTLIPGATGEVLDIAAIHGSLKFIGWRKYQAVVTVEGCEEKTSAEFIHNISATASFNNCQLQGSFSDNSGFCSNPTGINWFRLDANGNWPTVSTSENYYPTVSGVYALRYTFAGGVFTQAPTITVDFESCESIVPIITQTSCSTLEVDYDAGCRNSSIQWEWLASPTAVTGTPIPGATGAVLDIATIHGSLKRIDWRKYQAVVTVEGCGEKTSAEFIHDISATASFNNCQLQGSFSDNSGFCLNPIGIRWMHLHANGDWPTVSTSNSFYPTEPGAYALRYTFAGGVYTQTSITIDFESCENISLELQRISCDEIELVIPNQCRAIESIKWQYTNLTAGSPWHIIEENNSEVLYLENAQLHAKYISNWRYRALVTFAGCDERPSPEIILESSASLSYSNCTLTGSISDDYCTGTPSLVDIIYAPFDGSVPWDRVALGNSHVPTKSGNYIFRSFVEGAIIQSSAFPVNLINCNSINPTLTRNSCKELLLDFDKGCRNVNDIKWEWSPADANDWTAIQPLNDGSEILDLSILTGGGQFLHLRKYKATILVEGCNPKFVEIGPFNDVELTFDGCTLTGVINSDYCTDTPSYSDIVYQPIGSAAPYAIAVESSSFVPIVSGWYAARFIVDGYWIQSSAIRVDKDDFTSIVNDCCTVSIVSEVACIDGKVSWQWRDVNNRSNGWSNISGYDGQVFDLAIDANYAHYNNKEYQAIISSGAQTIESDIVHVVSHISLSKSECRFTATLLDNAGNELEQCDIYKYQWHYRGSSGPDVLLDNTTEPYYDYQGPAGEILATLFYNSGCARGIAIPADQCSCDSEYEICSSGQICNGSSVTIGACETKPDIFMQRPLNAANGWTTQSDVGGQGLIGDGELSFTLKESVNNTADMIGLNSDPHTNADQTSLDFAFYIWIHHSYSDPYRVYIYENGKSTGFRKMQDESLVDTQFAIERIGSDIIYKINGEEVYRSKKQSSATLYYDNSFHTHGGTWATGKSSYRDIKLFGEQEGVTYNWSTGENTSNISTDTPGNYQVTITDSEGCQNIYSESVSEDPNCTCISEYEICSSGQICNGSTVTLGPCQIFPDITQQRPLPLGSWANQVGVGGAPIKGNGELSFTLKEAISSSANMLGLNSDPHTDADQTSIDYGMYVQIYQAYETPYRIYIYENGESKGLVHSQVESFEGSQFGLRREDGIVQYLFNGEVVYQSATISDSGLYFDNSFYSGGGSWATGKSIFENIKLFGEQEGVSYAWSTGETTSTIQTDNPGLYNVTITDIEGCQDVYSKSVSEDPNCTCETEFEICSSGQICNGSSVTLGPCIIKPDLDLQRPLPLASWANQSNVGGTPLTGDGVLSFTLAEAELNSANVFGLNSDPFTDSKSESIDYGMYVQIYHPYARPYRIYVIENGVNVGLKYSSTESFVGSNFSIRRAEGNIEYLINDEVLYESQANSTNELYYDNSFYSATTGNWANGHSIFSDIKIFGEQDGLTYTWSTGETTASISTFNPGSYQLTLTDPQGCVSSKSIDVNIDPECTCDIEAEICSFGTLCEGGNVSLEVCIPKDNVMLQRPLEVDGWENQYHVGGTPITGDGEVSFSFKSISGNTANMIGLSSSPNRNSSYDFDYAMYFYISLNLDNPYNIYIYEYASSKGLQYAQSEPFTDSKFTVKRENNTIKYLKDDVVIYTSLNENSQTLYFDNSFLSAETGHWAGGSSAVENIRVKSYDGNSYSWNTGATSSSIDVSAAGNYQVTVTDASGCQSVSNIDVPASEPSISPELFAAGDLCKDDFVTLSFTETKQDLLLQRPLAIQSWSNQYEVGGAPLIGDGELNFTVDGIEGNSVGMIGLNNDPHTDGHYASLDYALYFYINHDIADTPYRVHIRENGVDLGFPVAQAEPFNGSTFGIKRENGNVTYLKDGQVIYTSTIQSTVDLFFDNSFYSSIGGNWSGGNINFKNIEISNALDNGTYAWSTGETTPSIDVTTAGTYSVTITEEGKCSSEVSHTIEDCMEACECIVDGISASRESLSLLSIDLPDNLCATPTIKWYHSRSDISTPWTHLDGHDESSTLNIATLTEPIQQRVDLSKYKVEVSIGDCTFEEEFLPVISVTSSFENCVLDGSCISAEGYCSENIGVTWILNNANYSWTGISADLNYQPIEDGYYVLQYNFPGGVFIQAPGITITEVCLENTITLCNDGIDNDGDGVIDCLDEDCVEFHICDPNYDPNYDPYCDVLSLITIKRDGLQTLDVSYKVEGELAPTQSKMAALGLTQNDVEAKISDFKSIKFLLEKDVNTELILKDTVHLRMGSMRRDNLEWQQYARTDIPILDTILVNKEYSLLLKSMSSELTQCPDDIVTVLEDGCPLEFTASACSNAFDDKDETAISINISSGEGPFKVTVFNGEAPLVKGESRLYQQEGYQDAQIAISVAPKSKYLIIVENGECIERRSIIASNEIADEIIITPDPLTSCISLDEIYQRLGCYVEEIEDCVFLYAGETELIPDENGNICFEDGTPSISITITRKGDKVISKDINTFPDNDGDGIPNSRDKDIDGDDIPNLDETGPDEDIDGDGILNKDDPDRDDDGVPNDEDDTPDGSGEEICDNGIDDDGDGYSDCELECFTNELNAKILKSSNDCIDWDCSLTDIASYDRFVSDLETEVNSIEFQDHLNKLRKIIEFFEDCEEGNWTGYDDESILPRCFWENNSSLALMSGLIDGAFIEVNGIIDFVGSLDEITASLTKITVQHLMYQTYVCNPNVLCATEEALTSVFQELEIDPENIDNWQWFELLVFDQGIVNAIGYVDYCTLQLEINAAIDALVEIIDTRTEIESLLILADEVISEYFSDLIQNDIETWYLTGRGILQVGSAVFEIGALSKSNKIRELLRAIANGNQQALRKLRELVITYQIWINSFDRIEDFVDASVPDQIKNLIIQGDLESDVLEDVYDIVKDLSENKGRKLTWPEILVLFKRGNDFNDKARINNWYPYVEVYLDNGKYLDALDLDAGLIVSRKATTLSNIKFETFKKYISELTTKYCKGKVIKTKKPEYIDIRDEILPWDGQYVLEIPDINENLSNIQLYHDYANIHDVILKFRPE